MIGFLDFITQVVLKNIYAINIGCNICIHFKTYLTHVEYKYLIKIHVSETHHKFQKMIKNSI